MAAAAVVEFQRAQSLLSTDREASIDILHSIGKGRRAASPALPAQLGFCRSGGRAGGAGRSDLPGDPRVPLLWEALKQPPSSLAGC
ncbi:hypothetical protein P7K49_011178 [Saguinus oedipus]|uniref:Uncharacterized protein n=1 Tax=Saguinus oedipus TaxID=9490 RepID=A0ABQ9VQ87_SAGOE|nr:hypothetical protein P7K49_011178 [Saguinus oedipus]